MTSGEDDERRTETAAGGPTPADITLLLCSSGLTAWMAAQDTSLALTTYQAGRLFLLGRKPDGGLRAHERFVEHCQGLWTDGDTLWTSSKAMLWRFGNDLPPGGITERGATRRFVPREGRVTGAVDTHDIAVGDTGDGRRGPIFVATAFNCLATVSDTHSFRPLWRPKFVSALVAEDRCHLNGLAMDGDRPAFVSAISRSDVADGWRERRRDGGVIVDVATGEIVSTGLSMPHSPRLYDGKLWVLNSGEGQLGSIDPATGRFESVAFLPGYARGLAFSGRYAIVGLSRPRHNHTFEGLALQNLLAEKDAVPRCGLVVIDTHSGRTVEWLRFEHTIDELYDVAVLPGIAQAEAVGFVGQTIEQVVSVEGG
jgi:uncharacterized protein (TIGR03032 family)